MSFLIIHSACAESNMNISEHSGDLPEENLHGIVACKNTLPAFTVRV